jgi:hypothetical protein
MAELAFAIKFSENPLERNQPAGDIQANGIITSLETLLNNNTSNAENYDPNLPKIEVGLVLFGNSANDSNFYNAFKITDIAYSTGITIYFLERVPNLDTITTFFP